MKTDNGRGAKRAKVELRMKVLAAVKPARVFDAFCGLGEMYRAAWSEAAEYTGCDSRPWDLSQPARYVADNILVLRSLGLERFNVFDFDAYGAPWDQMLVLMARRKWDPGERGAVVLTDGSSMKMRYGSMSSAMSKILGIERDALPRSDANSDALQSMLLTKWCVSSGVSALHCWRAEGKGSGRGGQRMSYTALVFEGQATSVN